MSFNQHIRLLSSVLTQWLDHGSPSTPYRLRQWPPHQLYQLTLLRLSLPLPSPPASRSPQLLTTTRLFRRTEPGRLIETSCVCCVTDFLLSSLFLLWQIVITFVLGIETKVTLEKERRAFIIKHNCSALYAIKLNTVLIHSSFVIQWMSRMTRKHLCNYLFPMAV